MNIVIIGLGGIGRTALKSLAAEGHTITVIDENKPLVEELIETFDILGVVGNGACMDIQREAGVPQADLVIAFTRNDEQNIFACLVARRLGAGHTVARVRNPDYQSQIMQMREDLGISLVINPEYETAAEIFHLINLPSVSGMEHFAEGKVLLVEITAAEGSPLVGESLLSLRRKLHAKVLVCAVRRGDEVVIPGGSFVLRAGDRIHLTADPDNLNRFLAEARLSGPPLRTVIIAGGSRTAFYLADALSARRAVKLIEPDAARADALAIALPRVSVICGPGTQHALLDREGIAGADVFVALTDADEENMIVSLFAAGRRVRKTIAKLEDEALSAMLDELGIASRISPRQIIADRIVSYARALANSAGSGVQTLYRLVNDRVEALEFIARGPSAILGRPLKELHIKSGCLVACIIRGRRVIIPDGDAVLMPGDAVVVVTTRKSFSDLSDVFEQVTP